LVNTKENQTRREYIDLRASIFEKSFLDKCIDICRNDTPESINRILENRKAFLNALGDTIVERRCQSHLRIKEISLLRTSAYLLHYLLHQLEYMNAANTSSAVMNHAARVKQLQCVLLRREISDIVRTYMNAEMHLKIDAFLNVVELLSVVRICKPLLSTVLGHALGVSGDRFKKAASACSYRTVEQNPLEVLIVATPRKGSKTARFTDFRLLEIVVFDNANICRFEKEKTAVSSAEAPGLATMPPLRSTDVRDGSSVLADMLWHTLDQFGPEAEACSGPVTAGDSRFRAWSTDVRLERPTNKTLFTGAIGDRWYLHSRGSFYCPGVTMGG
jgi:hypothetical protein